MVDFLFFLWISLRYMIRWIGIFFGGNFGNVFWLVGILELLISCGNLGTVIFFWFGEMTKGFIRL